jgi:hypothetical protein
MRQAGIRSLRFVLVLSFSVFAMTSLSACSILGRKVSAFERGALSKNGMQLIGAPKEQAGMNHMFNAREGSSGGFGGAGGGCGCN